MNRATGRNLLLACAAVLTTQVGYAGLFGHDIKGYDGPKLPDKQLAILEPSASLILSLDGHDLRSCGVSCVVRLVPGKHSVVLDYAGPGIAAGWTEHSKGTREYVFEVEAGKKYLLHCRRSARPELHGIRVTLLDTTDRKNIATLADDPI